MHIKFVDTESAIMSESDINTITKPTRSHVTKIYLLTSMHFLAIIGMRGYRIYTRKLNSSHRHSK